MTTPYEIVDYFATVAGPVDGASVRAYKASHFGSPPVLPVKDQVPPNVTPEAADVSGNGGPGRYVLNVPTNELYYICVTFNGHFYWGPSMPEWTTGVTTGELDVSALTIGGQAAATAASVTAEQARAEAAEGLAALKANNGSDFADPGATRANLHVPILASVQAVVSTNIASLSAPGAGPFDGYAPSAGDQILLTAQSTASQNGPWIWHGASSALTRPTDYGSGAVVKGRFVQVNAGTLNGGALWVMTTTGSVTVDTTATTWQIGNRTPNDARYQGLAVKDQGGQVFNVKVYGAKGDGSTDDTTAIAAAVAAATAVNGIVFTPAGTYAIAGTITIPGSVSLWGAGHGWSGDAATTFKCTAAGAGLVVAAGSGGSCRDFCVNGNSVATVPLKRYEAVINTGGYRLWENVAVINSAQDNWTILAAQNDCFVNCISNAAARDNLYIDQGAGGFVFLNWQDFSAGRYGVHMDALVAGGPYSAGPEDISFYGGITEKSSGTPTSQVYMRHCKDILFDHVEIFGTGGDTGPVVDLDMSTCSVIRFPNCVISATITGGGANPGFVCVKTVGSTGQLYLDNVYFLAGDTSLYVASGAPVVYGSNWTDGTTNGPVSSANQIDSIIIGRTGPWTTATLLNSWVSNDSGSTYFAPRYRMLKGGRVEIGGTAKTGTPGTTAFTLPAGMRPARAQLFPMLISGNTVGFVQVTTAGNVSLNGVNAGNGCWFDGVCIDLS